MAHYTEFKHPEYKDNVQKWIDTQRIYNGTAYDYTPSVDSYGNLKGSDTSEIKRFIPKKSQREHLDAYNERLALLDPQMLFFTGITSLIGIFANAEKATKIVWQPEEEKVTGFGDETDKASIAYRFSNNADGKGTNLEFINNKMAINLSLTQKMWVLVDGIQKENGISVGDASVKLINPELVPNWHYDNNGKLDWVIVKELREQRISYMDEPKPKEMFTEFKLEGWRRFYVNSEGNEIEDASGEYAFYRTEKKGEQDRILPIFLVEIPLDVNAGYLWARKSNAIMNMESRLDFAHMTLPFALKQIVAKDIDELNKVIKGLKEGGNTLSIDPSSGRDHKFLEQDSSFLEASAKRLETKVKDFFHSMFKAYGDSAKQKTATEINLDSKTGLEAYLSLLVGAINEFNFNMFYRLSQVYFPDKPKVWGDVTVNRAGDFSPKDIDQALDEVVERYFDGRVPITKDQIIEKLKEIWERDGLAIPKDETEIQAIADQIIAGSSQEKNLFEEFGV